MPSARPAARSGGAPTVDAKRRSVYVSTGNAYADPPQKMTNAIVALDIDKGTVKWFYQATPNDVWLGGCGARSNGNLGCPEQQGPDFDFSAAPLLATAGNTSVADHSAEVGRRLRRRSRQPASWSGSTASDRAADSAGAGAHRLTEQNVYFGVGDAQTPNAWWRARPRRLPPASRCGPPLRRNPRLCASTPRCNASQGGATTVIPGAVLAGSHDGGLRAYSTEDGKVLWEFDTNKTVRHRERRQGHRRQYRRLSAHRRRRHDLRELGIRRHRRASGQRAAGLRGGYGHGRSGTRRPGKGTPTYSQAGPGPALAQAPRGPGPFSPAHTVRVPWPSSRTDQIPPTTDDVDRIAAIDDPIVRNLRITYCYAQLSTAVAERTGSCSNWCTFATWASRQAGATIRGEDLLDTLRRRLRLPLGGTAPDSIDVARTAAPRDVPAPTSRLGRIVRAIHTPFDAFEATSDAVARGNLKVFAEIGARVCGWLAICPADATIHSAEFTRFLNTLRPGDPPDGQIHLQQAFTAYQRQRIESDPKRRAELVALG